MVLAIALNKFEDGAVVNVCDLLEKGIISKCEYGVKILGNGELTKRPYAWPDGRSGS